MTRTHSKHHRLYIDGIDLSGHALALPSVSWGSEPAPASALSDNIKNILVTQSMITMEAINVFLDNDAAGAFNKHSNNSGEINVAFGIGLNAAPAQGDPAFAWKMKQSSYLGEQGDGFVVANIGISGPSSEGVLTYDKPWGNILNPLSARTGVNSSTGIDDVEASSLLGGIFFFHLTTSNGTVTLTVEEASINSDGNFGALSGATSGSIDASSSPKHGLIALGTTAAVKRYLRWQLAFGTASTATFFCGFIRG